MIHPFNEMIVVEFYIRCLSFQTNHIRLKACWDRVVLLSYRLFVICGSHLMNTAQIHFSDVR